jgi:hypothetical protein
MCSTGSESALVASSAALNAWTTIKLESAAGSISVNGSTVACACRSGGPVWAFLGEGFLDRAYGYSSECVEHDVLALQSRPLVSTHLSKF